MICSRSTKPQGREKQSFSCRSCALSAKPRLDLHMHVGKSTTVAIFFSVTDILETPTYRPLMIGELVHVLSPFTGEKTEDKVMQILRGKTWIQTQVVWPWSPCIQPRRQTAWRRPAQDCVRQSVESSRAEQREGPRQRAHCGWEAWAQI